MLSIKQFKIFTLLGATTLVAAHSANAQQIPSSTQPGAIERQYRIEEDRPQVGGAPVITSDDNGTKQLRGDMTFTLKNVEFEGLNQFTQEDLSPMYRDKLGHKISVTELGNIVNAITAHYRNNGYILSRAVLPPQRIESGTVKIRIVEGFVNSVSVQGDVDSSSVIHDYAQKIKNSKPLNAAVLERYLLLMQDLPGVDARAVLTPAPGVQGASDVVVTITRKPFEASATLDNRGSRFLGPIQAGATVAGNNILGMDEQTQVRVINTVFEPEELKYYELRHEQQLGSEGLKLVLSGSYVTTHPGSYIDNLDIVGKSATLTAGLSYPVIRSRQTNWFVNGDFTSRNTDVNSLGLNLYTDETRVFGLGTTYDFLDSWSAVNRMEAKLYQGVNWGTGMDNGVPRSRLNDGTSFTKLAAEVSRLQPLGGKFSLYAAAAGQYSKDPLLASEEFVVGGADFGSAYDPAEITGDSGAAARFELQYNDSPQYAYLSQYQLYGFYDVGRVWNKDIILNSEVDRSSLASTGIGVRFNVNSSISGSLEGAVPLTREVAANRADGAAPRVFFGLQYRY